MRVGKVKNGEKKQQQVILINKVFELYVYYKYNIRRELILILKIYCKKIN